MFVELFCVEAGANLHVPTPVCFVDMNTILLLGGCCLCRAFFTTDSNCPLALQCRLVAGLDQAGKTTLVHALCRPTVSPCGGNVDDAHAYIWPCYAPTTAAAQFQWHCPAPGGFVSSRTGASGARPENDPAILANGTTYRIIDAPGNSMHRSSWSALAAEAGSVAFLIYIVDLTDTERMAVARAELDSLISKMGAYFGSWYAIFVFAYLIGVF